MQFNTQAYFIMFFHHLFYETKSENIISFYIESKLIEL